MLDIPLLYVTSFNKQLYYATGKKLLATYLKYKIQSPLLITYEDNIDNKLPHKQNFKLYNLDKDNILQNWLKHFKFIIPKEYGGTALSCSCKLDKSKINYNWHGHQFGCPHSEWNRRASKWFRKIVALNYALTLNPDKILFLDSDVYFTNHLPEKAINNIFRENGLIYHYGPYRSRIKTGIESGVIGFAREGGGFQFLEKVIHCFTSGEFMQFPRWDDGYIFKVLLEKTPKNVLGRRDVVSVERRSSHVVNLGLFRHFLVHDKGHHSRIHKII